MLVTISFTKKDSGEKMSPKLFDFEDDIVEMWDGEPPEHVREMWENTQNHLDQCPEEQIILEYCKAIEKIFEEGLIRPE